VWFIATETVTMTEIEGAIYATVMTEGIGITTDVLTAIVDLMIADLTTDASIMTGALVAPTGAGTAVAGSTGMAAGGFTKTLALAESRKRRNAKSIAFRLLCFACSNGGRAAGGC
jgi:hypothetical protein